MMFNAFTIETGTEFCAISKDVYDGVLSDRTKTTSTRLNNSNAIAYSNLVEGLHAI